MNLTGIAIVKRGIEIAMVIARHDEPSHHIHQDWMQTYLAPWPLSVCPGTECRAEFAALDSAVGDRDAGTTGTAST